MGLSCCEGLSSFANAMFVLCSSVLGLLAGGPGHWTTRSYLESTIGAVVPTNAHNAAQSEQPSAAPPPDSLVDPEATRTEEEEVPPPAILAQRKSEEERLQALAQRRLEEELQRELEELERMDEEDVTAEEEEEQQKQQKKKPQVVFLDLRSIPGRSLSKEEVITALNMIPTFYLVDDDEEMVGSLDAGGKESICWYLDPSEALSALVLKHEGMVAAPAGAQKDVHLAVTPLGAAYAVTEGWVASRAKLPLRIQASQPLVAAVTEILSVDPSTIAEEGSSGCGFVPIFASEQFASSTRMPFFTSPRDFVAAWTAVGLPADKVPAELTIVPLTKLVDLMLSGSPGSDWTAALFVPGEQTMQIAVACQTALEARAKKRTMKQMMRAAGMPAVEKQLLEPAADDDDEDDDDEEE